MITFSTALIFIFQVLGSESTKTGLAPLFIIAKAQEIIVNVGIITSSPGPIFKAATAISNAAVPFEQAIPYFLLIFLLNSNSNFSTNGPSDEIHPVSMHSLISSFSLSPIEGSFTGINLSIFTQDNRNPPGIQ